MNSPFANLFLALQEHIQTEVPAVRHIDQDLGQLKTSTRPPVSWPCVLIDFETFDYENLAENVQTVTGTIVFRLGFAPHSNTAQATPAPYVQQAITCYDIEWDLHIALQGWAPGSDYGHLCRTSVSTQKRTDSYRVRELRYSIAFHDFSAKWYQHRAPAQLRIIDHLRLPE